MSIFIAKTSCVHFRKLQENGMLGYKLSITYNVGHTEKQCSLYKYGQKRDFAHFLCDFRFFNNLPLGQFSSKNIEVYLFRIFRWCSKRP